jgi:hypothetical protein
MASWISASTTLRSPCSDSPALYFPLLLIFFHIRLFSERASERAHVVSDDDVFVHTVAESVASVGFCLSVLPSRDWERKGTLMFTCYDTVYDGYEEGLWHQGTGQRRIG